MHTRWHWPAFALSIAFLLSACSTAADLSTEQPRPEITQDESATARGPDVGQPTVAAERPETSLLQLGALSLDWELQPVGEGIKPAFAIDGAGVAHVAFLTEAEHGVLFYAQNRSGNFELETVSEGYFYGPVDLALDPNDAPLIAYHDHQATSFDPELGDEVVAIRDERVWELVTVSDDGHDGWDNSIVVDPEGYWHTAAVDPSQFGSQDGVEYASNASGSVSVSTVGSGAIKYEFATSIALDSIGSPAIAYYNDRDQQLEYASLENDGWTIHVVDAEGDAGRYASLVFDSDFDPHIAYYTADTRNAGSVNHAWRDEAGWHVERVAELGNLQMGHTGARKITSLAIGPDGSLHLAFTDRDQLIYAQRTEAGWIGQEVLPTGSRELGQLVELAIDAQGMPHLISYEVVSSSPFQGAVFYAVGG